MLLYTGEIDYEKFYLENSVKNKDTMVVGVKYEDKPFVFQTCVMKISGGKCNFDSKTKANMLKFINDFEHILIKNISENSERIFGRKFSEKKLSDSFDNSWEITNDGIVSMTLDAESIEDDKSVYCIFKVEQIVFTKTRFSIKYVLSNLKEKKRIVTPVKNYFAENVNKSLILLSDANQKEPSTDNFF